MRRRSDARTGKGSRGERGRARRVAVWLAALLAAGVAGPAAAQVSPNGPQFQVNTYTTSYQMYPAISADGQGRFVVA